MVPNNIKKTKSEQAFDLYKQGLLLKDIAKKLEVPEGTVRSWKYRQKWDGEKKATQRKPKRNVAKKNKGGAPKGNKNALGNKGGAPKGSRNAEKYGFYAKWLPEETAEIMGQIENSNPIDLLWDNIVLQYTAIIRAQKIMFVEDKEDSTTTKIGNSKGKSGTSTKWEVQQAWDKHASFLTAQSRAMKTLESMIFKYEDMLNKNWDMATEEQRLRIEQIKIEVAQSAPTDKVVRIIDDI